jgi:hypothetical protein
MVAIGLPEWSTTEAGWTVVIPGRVDRLRQTLERVIDLPQQL